ncbi:MAG: ATP-binding protein [Nanoarchaeota archaeon]|nr:ATP-binding protein [Nanoarchaeota archaeon]
MEEFYNRYRELDILKEKYDYLKNGELCILYGRRRIGKTALVLKFLESVKTKKLYFYTNKLTRKGLMDQFSKDISNQTNDNIKISESWDSFFDYIEDESSKEKLVLIIDEFQRFSKISEDFITILQYRWDIKLKNRKVMIILLGSSMGMTHNLVFSSKGPLYGRHTIKMKIKPFRYIDFRQMFSYLKSEEEKINHYAVLGGTAHYLTLAKNLNKNLFGIIDNLILTEGSPLYDEPITLLSSELKSYSRHNSILISIARGNKEMKAFATTLGLEQTQITPHIDHLTNKLDLVRKTVPFFGKKRKTRYELDDNFFKFWYRFVFPNKSTLELKNKQIIQEKIKQQFNKYVSFIFEDIIKELLILYNMGKIKNLKINFEKIGSWWENDEEIDIVAYSKRELLLGEVKWKNKPLNGLTILNKLKQKSKKLNFSGRIRYMLFLKNGFSEDTKEILEKEDVLCLDLNEIENLFNGASKKESSKQRTLSAYRN